MPTCQLLDWACGRIAGSLWWYSMISVSFEVILIWEMHVELCAHRPSLKLKRCVGQVEGRRWEQGKMLQQHLVKGYLKLTKTAQGVLLTCVLNVCWCPRFIRCFTFTNVCPSLLHVVCPQPIFLFLPGRNSILGRRPQVLWPWSAAAAVYNSSLRPLLLRGQRSVWYSARWTNDGHI